MAALRTNDMATVEKDLLKAVRLGTPVPDWANPMLTGASGSTSFVNYIPSVAGSATYSATELTGR